MLRRFLALAILLIALNRQSRVQHVTAASIEELHPDDEPRKQATSATIQTAAHESAPSGGQAERTTTIALSRRPDHRRPIWALAHMVNSIRELDYRLKTGANGIEADVVFSKDGDPMYTYHGPPCDCWRHCNQQENFDDYLGFVRALYNEKWLDEEGGNNPNQLAMLFLDLKLDPLDQLAKQRAGNKLAISIVNHLYPNENAQRLDKPGDAATAAAANTAADSLRLIMSINRASDIDLIRNFIHTLEMRNASHLLRDNIGFDVGMNDDLHAIESMWQKFANIGIHLNLWQGDGLTNCLSPFYNLERLTRAVAKRDDPAGYPAKVYHWTIDLHDRMRESLLMGVDAIMTNHPERLLTVLKEPMIAHDFRLATRDDNPFKKLTRRIMGRSSEAARYQRSAYTPSGGFLYSLYDVFTSWLSYMREIPFLSYPTTLMSRSSSSASIKRRASWKTPKSPASDGRVVHLVPLTTLKAEPVYMMVTDATDITGQSHQERQSATSSSDSATGGAAITAMPATDIPNDVIPEYEGPKWYTSLFSSALVSVLRVMLPVNGN